MKIFDEDFQIENKEKWLKITDFENFFRIYESSLGNNFYNLNETMFIDNSGAQLDEYQLKHDMQWTLISYAIYDTTRLAWLLMKLNNIDLKDAFSIVKAGTKIKYLQKDVVQSLLVDINDFGNV